LTVDVEHAGAAGPDARATARATRGIFAGVVVATCGAYAAVTMAPVVALATTGSAFLAGLPTAALLAGAGVGAPRVSALISRRGHQAAFTAVYLLGTVACLLAVVAVVTGSFALLMIGVASVGIAHAANQLARYAAAELQPEERRPTVIGWMVWAQAVGAVLGPLSLVPAGRVSAVLGLPVEAGGFLVGVVLFAVAAASHVLAPRFRARREPAPPPAAGAPAPAAQPWVLPSVQVAVATMVACLSVMLLIMTVTPVHVHTAGHGVASVGAIMSSHTFGMFALAPLAGWLTARLGSVRTILAGLATLLLAAAAGATVPATSQLLLAVALFALGFGWCLGFVAASTLLTQGLDVSVRVHVQGRVEALTWITGAVAAVGSGLLLGLVGFPVLNLLAAALLIGPLAVIVRQRRALAPAGAAAG
jgi:MFS family permease